MVIRKKNIICSAGVGKSFLCGEAGFSTAGMALALLITLSLVFTAAQVYQINATSADIQNVADAAALAAENEVAEFYLVAQVCDAIVLSLSLTGIVVMGVGIVALCIPPTAVLGESLINAGTKVLKARDSFSSKAAAGLNKVQKVLPFLCAISAAQVISASGGGQMNTDYQGLALALPFEGEEIQIGVLDGLDSVIEEVDAEKETLKEAAIKAEEAAAAANEHKKEAFAHDCGNNPNYCMYERAGHLSGLSDEDNPLFQTVDAWDFSVPLKRAQAYYPARLANEAPTGTSPKEQAQSVLRKRFYTFAVTEIAKGYVYEEEDRFEAFFPRLPKNTTEMKQTSLYTEAVYPISSQGVTQVMHAYDQCPGIGGGIIGIGSAQQSEAEGFETCATCEFSVSNLGKIAAASTAIENGFEYHYSKVADAAEAYQEARRAFDPEAQLVKSKADSLFSKLADLAGDAASKRIEVQPPGRFGSIAFVVSVGQATVSESLLTSFVKGDHPLGSRAAISGAALVKGSPEEGATIISSLLNGAVDKYEGVLVVGADQLFGAWSSLLFAYTEGQESIERSLVKGLDGIPLVSQSGLGTWAADAFSDLMKGLGLEPAHLYAPRSALVNSIHIAVADNSSFAQQLVTIKQNHAEVSNLSGVFSSIGGSVFESMDWGDGTITVATIELFGEGGPGIPITISIPDAIKTQPGGFLEGIFGSIQGLVENVTGGRRWS